MQGGLLEPRLGSFRFLALIAELLAVSHALMVGLAWAASQWATALADHYKHTCTVGFSAVLFGLKTVLAHTLPGDQQIAGVTMPGKVSTRRHRRSTHTQDSPLCFQYSFWEAACAC